MTVEGESQFEFGSHAVGSADKDRFLDTQRTEVEHSSEGTYSTHTARTLGTVDMLFDTGYHFVSSFEVYTCLFVRLSHCFICFFDCFFFLAILGFLANLELLAILEGLAILGGD